MNRVESWIQRVREATWIDSRSLSIYRIMFGVMFILFFHRSYSWLVDVPPTFFSPPLLSLANLWDRLPPAWFFTGLNYLVLAFALLLTIGLRTRIASWGLLVLLIIGNSFSFSLGKIDHSILFLCVIASLSSSSWGRHWSVDSLLRKKRGEKNPTSFTDLALLAVFIAFAFFTAGFGKALVWIDLDLNTSGFLAWLFNQYYTAGHTALLATWAIKMPYPWLWEFADIAAVLFELGFFWAIFQRKRWFIWLIMMCFFHLVNTVIMNIPFPMNTMAAMAFFPWSRLAVPGLKWPALKYSALGLLAVGMVGSTEPMRVVRIDIAQSLMVSNENVSMTCFALSWIGLLLLFIWLLKSPYASTLPLPASDGRPRERVVPSRA